MVHEERRTDGGQAAGPHACQAKSWYTTLVWWPSFDRSAGHLTTSIEHEKYVCANVCIDATRSTQKKKHPCMQTQNRHDKSVKRESRLWGEGVGNFMKDWNYVSHHTHTNREGGTVVVTHRLQDKYVRGADTAI